MNADYSSQAYPATVSDFRLDKYEVTVGRFRAFVAAWVAGWRPASGQGKHGNLNDGNGIAMSGGGYELGWNNEWLSPSSPTYAAIPSAQSDWDSELSAGTWTTAPGGNEQKPIVGLSWYEAYAFCIWDEGFLPTEAEWNYAASGGDEQRAYPWGVTPPGNDTTKAIYNCLYGTGGCPIATNIAPVGTAVAGAGKWGHLDLAGNAREWVLDWSAPYQTPCVNCAQFGFADGRVYRGGSFYDPPEQLLSSDREQYPPRYPSIRVGVRCARLP